MREYQKYEFCKAVKCPDLMKGRCILGKDYPSFCVYSAKSFHKWLEENGFKIIKDG